MGRHSVLHIQHFVYPWRFPLFSEIAKEFDLTVLFCRAKRPFRQWDTTIPTNQGFFGVILRAVYVGPLTFNPGLFNALRKRYDIYSVAALDRINFIQFVVTLAVAKIRHKPFIMVDEFIATEYYRSRRKVAFAINRAIRAFIYRHVDAFVLWNDLAREFLETLGVPSHKIFSGPQVFSKRDEEFHRKPGEQCANDNLSERELIRLLFVGNLVETKGIDVLIKAFRELNHEAVRLEIVGDGPLREQLRRLAESDRRISFHGHLTGAAKREMFRNSHIFVLPSLHEPWGFVINEALEWGLPIITTKAVGAADYLVKDNGILVAAGDIKALHCAIASLVNDRATIQVMATASRHLSEHFTVRDMAKPFLDAVKSAYLTD